jgi:hypothetical protein
MDAKELGFKFQPGDTIRMLGCKDDLTVLTCTLVLTGKEQMATKSYEAVGKIFGDRVVRCPEPLAMPAPAGPTG